MSLIDHLRPQPRWKHEDAEVRAAAVQELGDDEAGILREMAREDPDAGVRRAALGRLSDAGLLADAARADPDESVRRAAEKLLQAVALAATDPGTGDAAVAGLSTPKRLARVASGAALETTRRAALSKLDDPKALVSVARHAPQGGIRQEALKRLIDETDRAEVAIKGDHDDTAQAAVEDIYDRAVLKRIGARARSPEVVARARARLEALGPEPHPPDPEEIQTRREEICHALEFLVHADSEERVRAGLAEAEVGWWQLPGPPGELLEQRYEAARRVLEEGLARREAQRAEKQRHARQVKEAIAPRRALCESVRSSRGEDALEKLQEARAAWAALPPFAHPDIDALQRRFTEECRACEADHARRQAEYERLARRVALCREAELLCESEDLTASRGRWKALRDAWSELPGGDTPVDTDLAARFRQAVARRDERDVETRQDRARERRENLQRLEDLCGTSERLLQSEQLTLKQADGGLRELAAALDAPGPLPSKRDQQRLERQLRRLKAALGARVRELRETVEWRRWANAGIREELCARLEELRASDDLERLARELRDIERRWRQARGRPKDQAEPLQERYEGVRDELRARCEAHFTRQAEEQAENLKRREALCERAEALADSTDWIGTADEIKKLQAEWKTIGPVSRRESRAIWLRFRAPCDRFFTRRKEDLGHRKQQWAENLVRKTALCEQAESLADSVEWEKTAGEIKRLQAEWKTIGAVRRSRSEPLWRRFRAACDHFFERYGRRDELERGARLSEREEVCREIETLLPTGDAPSAAAPEDLAQRVLAAHERWLRGGTIAHPDFDRLAERFAGSLQRIVAANPEIFRGTDLDCEANLKRMEQLCARVEGLLAGTGPVASSGASPAAILAAHWREAMASNTIGGGVSQESRWRMAAEEVKSAQAAWRRIGPVPGSAGEALTARFQRACRRIRGQRPPEARGRRT